MTKEEIEAETQKLLVVVHSAIEEFTKQTKRTVVRIDVEHDIYSDELDYRPIKQIHAIIMP